MSRIGEVQISRDALLHNLSALKSLITNGAKVAAVVKGNAYGHGMAEVVQVLEPHVDAFQVDDMDELRELRTLTQKRALVFGYVPIGEIDEAVSLGGELAVYDSDRLGAIANSGRKLGASPTVHLKIDALLGRQGVLPSDLSALLGELKKRPELDVASAYAHYGNIEDTTDPSHALEQERAFEECFAEVRQHFPDCGRHISATSGLMARESATGKNDLVRLGIGLYGLYPSEPLARSHARLELKPALRWVSLLAQVKTVPKGHPVGYGLTFVAPREMRIGIVPQGYADGYDRGLSNCGEVLVRGARCAAIGRVAMNMFAVDLSRVPDARQEDEVVLLGSQGEMEITAEEIAEKIGTINYEVVTRISPQLMRKLV